MANKENIIKEFYEAVNSFNNVIEFFEIYDVQLRKANIITDMVLADEHINSDLLQTLKNEAFVVYARLQQYINQTTHQINCYSIRFKEFFKNNARERLLFEIELDKLKPILTAKKAFVDEQIEKCFNCIQSYYNDVNSCD